MAPVLRTERLVLREWRPEDRPLFAAMNADPEVMEHYPALLSPDESDALADRFAARWTSDGMAPWAVEGADGFIGYVGLSYDASLPFGPATEVGWRLARPAWGHGYASEAARAALEWGFADGGLTEIQSWTAVGNVRSRAVMERIGMRHDPADDFDHPRIAEGHRLRRHVRYRIRP